MGASAYKSNKKTMSGLSLIITTRSASEEDKKKKMLTTFDPMFVWFVEARDITVFGTKPVCQMPIKAAS